MIDRVSRYLGLTEVRKKEDAVNATARNLARDVLAVRPNESRVFFLTGYDDDKIVEDVFQFSTIMSYEGVEVSPVIDLSIEGMRMEKDLNHVFLLWSGYFEDKIKFISFAKDIESGKLGLNLKGSSIVIAIPAELHNQMNIEDHSESGSKLGLTVPRSWKAESNLKLGLVMFSFSFLLWTLSYTLWFGFSWNWGQYSISFLFQKNIYLNRSEPLLTILISLVLTATGVLSILAAIRNKHFSGKLVVLASLLVFALFVIVQTLYVFQYDYPLGYHLTHMGTRTLTNANGIILASIVVMLYLVVFAIPAFVFGNRYTKFVTLVAIGFSSWIYLATIYSLFYIQFYAEYFWYLPLSPYFGGLEGIVINYKFPPYPNNSPFSIYLMISEFLFFISYFLAYASKDTIKAKVEDTHRSYIHRFQRL